MTQSIAPLRPVRRQAGAWLAAAGAAALMAAAAPALADVHWVVSGTFDDGGKLSGSFDINVYGYLSNFDLVTTAGTKEAGFEYTKADSYWSNGALYIDLEPGYRGDLHLAFANVLTTAVANDPIIGGARGPSFECVNSYSCYQAKGGPVRYLTEGFAASGGVNSLSRVLGSDRSIPEPSTWALMIAGFGLAGASLRRRRAPASA